MKIWITSFPFSIFHSKLILPWEDMREEIDAFDDEIFVDGIPCKYKNEIQNNYPSLFLCIISTIKYLFLQLLDRCNLLQMFRYLKGKLNNKTSLSKTLERIRILVLQILIFKSTNILKSHIIQEKCDYSYIFHVLLGLF